MELRGRPGAANRSPAGSQRGLSPGSPLPAASRGALLPPRPRARLGGIAIDKPHVLGPDGLDATIV
eukprot:CAMPEP_0204563588 /NCGR_PEP_ID=MMETSP0661-20131031/34398_1 /ASSEMBLY_ACC=CAM_ASM_000606 /TAXON_ID=109239 /ORGANISM="Alexandrium margalefi, Strain AMGDE01CS-322" /LENGTH=65 /DNA_ID=CAMNT_0051571155 /DNA_START=96 /DNA_END=293 /DNA_ORIENTATION=-